MKKKLTILLVSIVLASCNTFTVREGEIISQVQFEKEWQQAQYTTRNENCFWAAKDRYVVGDTVKFTK